MSMSDTSQGPGWWEASDGKWYPPEQHPNRRPPPPPPQSTAPLQAPPAATESPVTRIEPEQWNPRSVVLKSDGSPSAFLDAIASAIESVEYPITERSYADLRLTFESRGRSWKSSSGDVTTVLVSPIVRGSRATFTSKGKPSGLTRVQRKVDVTTWTGRILPGFGTLWRDPGHLPTPWIRTPK